MYTVIVPFTYVRGPVDGLKTEPKNVATVRYSPVENWWHTVTHERGSEGETGEWRGQPVLFTLPRNMVYPALLSLMRTRRLPVIDWSDAPADLNGLVRYDERRNLVSAHVPSRFKRSLTISYTILCSWQNTLFVLLCCVV